MVENPVSERQRLLDLSRQAQALVYQDSSRCAALATEAIELAQELDDSPTLAEMWLLHGRVHGLRAEYPPALTSFDHALELYQTLGKAEGQIRTLALMGGTYFITGNYTRAMEILFEGVAVSEAAGELRGKSTLLNSIALVWNRVSAHQKACELLEQALLLAREMGETVQETSLIANLGQAHVYACVQSQQKGQLAAARQHLEAALKHCQTAYALGMERQDGRSMVLGKLYLGLLYTRLGSPEKALPHLYELKARANLLGTKQYLGEGLVLIGDCQAQLGRPAEALGHYLRGIELLEAAGELWIVRPAYAAIAEVYAAQADWQNAAQFYKKQAQAEAAIKETVLDGYINNLETLLELNQTRRLAEQDMLTGVLNRRGLEAQLSTRIESAQQGGQAVTVVMADADHFKRINDDHSHLLGDAVLKELAQIIQRSCRPGDLVARFGGEEFTVVMQGIAGETARKRCEQIRQNVEHHDWERLRAGLRVTISVGWCDGTSAEDVGGLLEQADARLLEAKRAGRNRVCP